MANYVSQIYATLAGIVMVPLYIKYMGPEAYGLVGFFAMLQVWFGLLDVGLTPTITRESARYCGGAISALEYRRLARALEGVFFAVALLGSIFLFLMSEPMATGWLKASLLPSEEIIKSLQLIALIVALRWMSGLYRGIITGGEQLVWLSGFNILLATGRFVLVLPLLIYISAAPSTFFAFQLAMALLELAGLFWKAYQLLPPTLNNQSISWEWSPLKPILKFSISIAFTSSVWLLITQIDKIILSKFLPLEEFGYFTVAILVSGGIMLITTPISAAIMPRMTLLHAEGQHKKLILVYRKATQFVSVISINAALVLIFFGEEVLFAWTGNHLLIKSTASVMGIYAVGTAFLSVSAFPYYLQYAKGNLKLHIMGNLIMLVFLTPSIIWASTKYGAIGAAWAWAIINIAYFFLWTPLVHRKFAPNIHYAWLFNDILRPIILPLVTAIMLSHYYPWNEVSRVFLALELLTLILCLLLLSFLSLKFFKRQE